MARFIFIQPSGDDIKDPAAAEIVEFMRQDYDEHWGPYSPTGQLLYGTSHELILVRHPRRGW